MMIGVQVETSKLLLPQLITFCRAPKLSPGLVRSILPDLTRCSSSLGLRAVDSEDILDGKLTAVAIASRLHWTGHLALLDT